MCERVATKQYLAEESVEAMDLLLLLHVSVVLGNSEKSELLHEIDLVRLAHMFLHELGNCERERSRVKHDLALLRHECDETV